MDNASKISVMGFFANRAMDLRDTDYRRVVFRETEELIKENCAYDGGCDVKGYVMDMLRIAYHANDTKTAIDAIQWGVRNPIAIVTRFADAAENAQGYKNQMPKLYSETKFNPHMDEKFIERVFKKLRSIAIAAQDPALKEAVCSISLRLADDIKGIAPNLPLDLYKETAAAEWSQILQNQAVRAPQPVSVR